MSNYLWIGLGSALGGMLRFWLSEQLNRRGRIHFPLGTLLVNVSGSLAIGLLAACAQPAAGWLGSNHGRAFLMIGFCGGYTTFSAFSLQTLELAREGH